MIILNLPAQNIPSFKNEKTVFTNRRTGKPFIATKKSAKADMLELQLAIFEQLRRNHVRSEDVINGDIVPLDDSLGWIGFVENAWTVAMVKEDQLLEMRIERNWALEVRPQLYVVSLTWRIYKSLHRDGDNMVTSVLDAYLDALAKIGNMSRNALRVHATNVIKKKNRKCQ